MHRVAGISFAGSVSPLQRRAVHLAVGEELDDAQILRAVNTFAGYDAELLLEFIKGFEGRADLDEKSKGDLQAMRVAVAYRSAREGRGAA